MEALHHWASRSVDEVDVIKSEVLAAFSAPLHARVGVLSVLENIGHSHNSKYCRLDDIVATVREYCAE